MTGHTLPKTTPLEADGTSPIERIPSTYERVDEEATVSLFNPARPSGTITAKESLEWLLCETLQKTKELEI
jgi:histidinol-phosphate/aromatic aminotransferase/cobyric acid decarboxylase-like protein